MINFQFLVMINIKWEVQFIPSTIENKFSRDFLFCFTLPDFELLRKKANLWQISITRVKDNTKKRSNEICDLEVRWLNNDEIYRLESYFNFISIFF